MNRERYQRIRDIFHDVCDRPPGQQSALLESACGDDLDLRSAVEALLADQDTRILDFDEVASSLREALHGAGDDVDPSAHLPGMIGPYRILRLLGEGGMGVVYLAEQDRPKRTVAIKIIRPGFTTPSLLKRFEHETHVLGRLQHPGIAQIHDAGTALPEAGAESRFGIQPYLVMEYIDGEPLLEYARSNNLSSRDRLALFVRICDAIQHAHQKGIIHRDLKPANILVDGSGQPKVLDFGVSRATDSNLQLTTIAGSGGQMIGTLPYMSPEQTGGDGAEVDTRSDVYALGVILFELLSGQLPYDLRHQSMPQIARTIREAEAVRLGSLDRQWRGDLETIVAAALEKDKARRYQAVSELKQDITRHLNDQPILARPASRLYQWRKFTRRHKTLLGSVAAIFTVLIVATIMSSMLLVRALRAEHQASLRLVEATEAKAATEHALEREADERAEAERQARIAKAVNDFVTNDLLAQADPYRGHGPDVPLRTVLDQASSVIDDLFEDEPRIRAAIHETLGRTYESLALYDQAERHLRAAVELLTHEVGPAALETIKARNILGTALVMAWRTEDAEPFIRETLALAEQSLEPRHEQLAHPLGTLGILLKRRGEFTAAEQHYRRALDISRETFGPHHLTTLAIMNNLLLVLSDQKKHEEAEALAREVLELRRTVMGARHPGTAFALLNLGHVLWTRSTADEEIEPLWEESHDIFREVFSEEHQYTLRPLYGLALLRGARGEYVEAERLHRQVLDLRLRVLPEDHHEVLLSRQVLAGMIRRQGPHRHAEAEAMYRDILTLRQRLLGVEHPRTRRTRENLLSLLHERGDHEASVELQREWLEALRQAIEAPDVRPELINACAWHHLTVDVQELRDSAVALSAAERAVAQTDRRHPDMLDTLALALAEHGRLDEAIDVQREAVALVAETNAESGETSGEDFLTTLRAMQRLASVFSRSDRFEEAEAILSDVIAMYDENFMDRDVAQGAALRERGECLIELNRFEEAEQCLHLSFDILSATLGDLHQDAQRSARALVTLYEAWDEPELAVQWQARMSPVLAGDPD